MSKEGSLAFPGSEAYQNNTGRYSTLYAPTFRVVAVTKNEQDVAASLSCAAQTNTTFLLTGPRHGFSEEWKDWTDGFEIYTGAFNQVSIDTEANTLTAGGATVFQQVIDLTYAHQREIPTGSGGCVGLLGAGMGAGIGRLEGVHGLIIDSLLSVRLMLPNTTVIEVSDSKNPELMWGMRGAGWNFGFVLNATFRVYEQTPNGLHMNADFLFPKNITRSFHEILARQAPKMPGPLAISTAMIWNDIAKDTQLVVNAVYAGPEEDGLKAIKFLTDQGPVLRQNISMVPWNRLIQAAIFGSSGDQYCVKGIVRKSLWSAAFNEIDPEAHVKLLGKLEEMFAKYPQSRQSGAAIYLPSTVAARKVPDDTTSYGWRQALGHVNFDIVYDDPNTDDATVEHIPEQMRDIVYATAGTEGNQTYAGFGHGTEPVDVVFSKYKLPRLAALKKKYDPSGMFNAYHPLPTSWP